MLHLGPISDDQWELALSVLRMVSLSPTETLSQLFIPHRTYHTPEKLFKWHHKDTPLCPKCKGGPANLIHMLWRYPKLHLHWRGVIITINSVFQASLTEDPGICLLSMVDESSLPENTFTPIVRVLFQARKLIAQNGCLHIHQLWLNGEGK